MLAMFCWAQNSIDVGENEKSSHCREQSCGSTEVIVSLTISGMLVNNCRFE
jgi:hypothetical protein